MITGPVVYRLVKTGEFKHSDKGWDRLDQYVIQAEYETQYVKPDGSPHREWRNLVDRYFTLGEETQGLPINWFKQYQARYPHLPRWQVILGSR